MIDPALIPLIKVGMGCATVAAVAAMAVLPGRRTQRMPPRAGLAGLVAQMDRDIRAAVRVTPSGREPCLTPAQEEQAAKVHAAINRCGGLAAARPVAGRAFFEPAATPTMPVVAALATPEAWDACAGAVSWRDLPAMLAGKRCYGGVAVVDGTHAGLVWWFPAQEGVERPAVLARRIGVTGLCDLVKRDAGRFDVRQIGTGDAPGRLHGVSAAVDLDEQGLPVVLVAARWMRSGLDALGETIVEGGLDHGGAPVLGAEVKGWNRPDHSVSPLPLPPALAIAGLLAKFAEAAER